MFDFKGLDSSMPYADNVAYASSRLELIGSGNSRCVFAMDESRVLKMALNENGMIKNNVEKFYSDTNWERLARIIDHDEDFMWIVSERVSPVTETDFERLVGASIDILYVSLYYRSIDFPETDGKEPLPVADYMLQIIEQRRKAKEMPVIRELLEKANELSINTSNLPQLDSWGVRKTEKGEIPVIADYGSFDNRFRKFPLRNPD